MAKGLWLPTGKPNRRDRVAWTSAAPGNRRVAMASPKGQRDPRGQAAEESLTPPAAPQPLPESAGAAGDPDAPISRRDSETRLSAPRALQEGTREAAGGAKRPSRSGPRSLVASPAAGRATDALEAGREFPLPLAPASLEPRRARSGSPGSEKTPKRVGGFWVPSWPSAALGARTAVDLLPWRGSGRKCKRDRWWEGAFPGRKSPHSGRSLGWEETRLAAVQPRQARRVLTTSGEPEWGQPLLSPAEAWPFSFSLSSPPSPK